MTFKYFVSYDKEKDEFYAIVCDGHDMKNPNPIFEIDTTEEMLDYIKTGVMSHIDDTEGLTRHLIDMDTIRPDDEILLSEKALRF